MVLPHERAAYRGRPPLPENEPTHGEIFDALMEINEKLDRIELELKRR